MELHADQKMNKVNAQAVESLRTLLPEGFTLTQIEDQSAHVHLRIETANATTIEIIQSREQQENIMVMSDVITDTQSLQLINDIITHLKNVCD
jgi:hypothetical protein